MVRDRKGEKAYFFVIERIVIKFVSDNTAKNHCLCKNKRIFFTVRMIRKQFTIIHLLHKDKEISKPDLSLIRIIRERG